MQARFYAPWYGRFLSPDPGLDQHFELTQSWNIYSYVKNNPVMSFDPDGMADVPAQSAGINRLLARDPNILEALKASNNLSQRSFESAVRSGGMDNLNYGAGNNLRGVVGEGLMMGVLRNGAPMGAGVSAQPRLPSLMGQPDLLQMTPSFRMPMGRGELVRAFSYENVVQQNGAGGLSIGTLQLSERNQFAVFDTKSGISPSGISEGSKQVAETAASLRATGSVGTAFLVVDAAAWGKMGTKAQATVFNRLNAVGGKIMVINGYAQAVTERSRQLVNEAKRTQ